MGDGLPGAGVVSAPTTAEVRAEIAHEQRLGVGSLNSRCAALKHYALPIAEHRDALAAEVARLKAILECGSSPYGMHRCCHCDSEVT